MKKKFGLLLLVSITSILLSFIKVNIGPELPLNSSIPLISQKMKDVGGQMVSLNDVKTDKGLLVIFSCNTCPYVKLNAGRILELQTECKKQGIGCVVINSNEAQRNEDDSFDEMVKYAKEQGYVVNYLVDEGSKLADAFGATKTPHCFLFNSKGLVYKGAIDDNVKDPALVKVSYLKDAINAITNGETPKIQETKSVGCSIKRVE